MNKSGKDMQNINVTHKYNIDAVNNILAELEKREEKEAEGANADMTFNVLSPGGEDLEKLAPSSLLYSRIKAHELLVDYINNPLCAKELKPYHEKIIKIYESLGRCPRPDSEQMWTDDIDKELLFAGSEKNESTKEKKALVLPSLHQMILDDVIIPPDAEEEIFDELEQTQGSVALRKINDAKLPYFFMHTKNLPAPDTKTLFHIHADEFGENSQLEGGNPQSLIKYICSFLTKSQLASISPEHIQELSKTLFFKNIKHSTDEIRHAFDTKTALLLSGGWIAPPDSHAIYYEILPDQSGKSATFRLYNTGAGNRYHNSITEGYKTKFNSYCEWSGISREKLESKEFLRILYEMKTFKNLPESSKNTEYKEQDVYEALKRFLQPATENEGPTTFSLMMTPQRSGICAWRSLMAFMRTKMTLPDYKRFKCAIKLQSLVDYVEAQPQQAAMTPTEWRLIKKSHQKLCRSIVRLYQKGLIGNAYIESAEQALSPIRNWVHKHKQCGDKREITMPAVYKTCFDSTVMKTEFPTAVSLDKINSDGNELDDNVSNSSNPIAAPKNLELYEAIKECSTDDPKKINKELKNVSVLARKAWQQGEDIILYKSLIDYIGNLKLEEEFWNATLQKDPKNAETLITQLGELSQIFLNTCFCTPEAHVIHPEKIYTLYKIVYIQNLLCRLAYGNDLPCTGGQEICNSDLFLQFPEVKIQREMKKILSEVPISFIKPFFITEDPTSPFLQRFFYESEINPENGISFEEFIKQKYPKIIEKLHQSDSTFYNLPIASQNARIFISDLLPDWLKALRDAQIAVEYLTHSPVANLSLVNHAADISAQFELQDEEESVVIITLNGVNRNMLTGKEFIEIGKEIRSRYEGIYPPFKNKNLENTINNIKKLNLDSDVNKEKFIIKFLSENKAVDKSIIINLFVENSLQKIEIINYFLKNPEKINDPDYQTILSMILLNNLDKEIEIPGFKELLSRFIEKNYEQFIFTNEINTIVFILKLSNQLQKFCPENVFYSTTIQKLYDLINKNETTIDNKVLIYAELITQISQKPFLNDEDIETILKGAIFIATNQKNSIHNIDPATNKRLQELFIVHRKTLQKKLEEGEPNQKLLNTLFHSAYPEKKEHLQWCLCRDQKGLPLFTTADGRHCFDLSLWNFSTTNMPVLLPFAIRSASIFKKFFPNIEQATLSAPGVYTFIDSHNRATRVAMYRGAIVVEQQL